LRLSRVSTAAALGRIALVWASIAAALYVSLALVPPWRSSAGVLVFALTLVFVASRQQALLVLAHDAVHKLLARPVGFGEVLGRMTCAFPVFISLHKWRFIHMWHHGRTATEEDPDLAIYDRFPLERAQLRRLLLRDLTGLNTIAVLHYFIDLPFGSRAFNRRLLGEARAAQYEARRDMHAFWLFWACVIAGLTAAFGWRGLAVLAAYWLVPYATLNLFMLRLRGALEHGATDDRVHPLRRTRTYTMSPVLEYFLAPMGINYHLEHHLYPSVPVYRLAELHRVLAQTEYSGHNPAIEPLSLGLQRVTRPPRLPS
jgi:fatty acid desaturase